MAPAVVSHEALMRSLVLVALLTLSAAPAFAQVDFSGEWAPRYHEDQPERVPGPELGDYLGIPINDAARMRADTWDAVDPDAARVAVPAALGRLHLARAVAAEDPQGSEPADARDRSRSTPSGCARSTTRSTSTAGRTRPKTRRTPGAASRPGKWEGNMLTITTTHLKEGLPPPQRPAAQRQGDGHRALDPPRRFPDRRDHRERSGLPDRAVHPHHRLRARRHQQVPPYPCEVVQEIDRPKGVVPHFLPGTNPYLLEFAQKFGIPVEAVPGRRRNDVSGLPDEAAARCRRRRRLRALRPGSHPRAGPTRRRQRA